MYCGLYNCHPLPYPSVFTDLNSSAIPDILTLLAEEEITCFTADAAIQDDIIALESITSFVLEIFDTEPSDATRVMIGQDIFMVSIVDDDGIHFAIRA